MGLGRLSQLSVGGTEKSTSRRRSKEKEKKMRKKEGLAEEKRKEK